MGIRSNERANRLVKRGSPIDHKSQREGSNKLEAEGGKKGQGDGNWAAVRWYRKVFVNYTYCRTGEGNFRVSLI